MAFEEFQIFTLTPSQTILALLVVAPILLVCYSVIYSLYLSPLSKFPGPKLWACSQLFYQAAVANGVAHRKLKAFFEQYGPVVRITPNELVFSSAEAVRDLYGNTHIQKQLGGKKEVLSKDERVYNKFGAAEDHLVCALDHNVHARQRRMLSTAFSERSLREQEPMLMENIDKLVAGVRRQGIEQDKPVDIKQWVNFTTFDVTGYLVFGESFHCLDNAELHPWVAFMTDSVKAQTLMGLFLRVPGMTALMPLLMPKKVKAAFEEHRLLAYNRLEQRLEQGQVTEKADLVGLLLKNGITQKAGGFSSGEDHISKGELHANSAILIIAGSETSSSLLSGAIFFLARNPHLQRRLANEIHSAFPSIESLSTTAAAKLPFLHAVIQETLRIYPPAANVLSRRTPAGGATIDGYHVPENTYVGFPHWAAYHQERSFSRADEWIPERWINGGGKEFEGDRKDVLQPFSVGPYNCIGINLAWAEIRLILCKLLWNFEFELCPGQEGWYEDQKVYLTWERPELMVKVKERKFD